MRPRKDYGHIGPGLQRLNPNKSQSGAGTPWLWRWLKSIISLTMAGQSRKWMILVATIWIQSFAGTNFDFSAYSTAMKSVLRISQVELNYLAVASDMGKVLGWSSGLALMYMPLPVVLFIAAFMGFVGYGFQWLVITQLISLPYFLVFLLCLLAGCSICWFNTVCFVLCTRNFPSNLQPLAIALTVSFNGVSAALYALIANAINPSSASLYLLLNAMLPLLASTAALVPILQQSSLNTYLPTREASHRDSPIFLLLNLLAALTGAFLLIFTSSSSSAPGLLLSGALFLLIFPLCVPGMVYARDRFTKKIIHSSFQLNQGSGSILVDADDLELHKALLSRNENNQDIIGTMSSSKNSSHQQDGVCNDIVMRKNKLARLEEEHSARDVILRVNFWIYYTAYFCGGTIGLVFSNNLGQIAESLGHGYKTTTLVTLYSSFSFFGRLLSAAPDYIRARFYFARTGWLTIALLPTPIAFFFLAASGSAATLHVATALVGLSSGFIFAAAVSITSELFGPNSMSVNHNILITNIPIGSLLYGLLAAIVYDSNGYIRVAQDLGSNTVVCMGRKCYFMTFVWWGCISVVGLVSSLILFFRTQHAYHHFEHSRTMQLVY